MSTTIKCVLEREVAGPFPITADIARSLCLALLEGGHAAMVDRDPSTMAAWHIDPQSLAQAAHARGLAQDPGVANAIVAALRLGWLLNVDSGTPGGLLNDARPEITVTREAADEPQVQWCSSSAGDLLAILGYEYDSRKGLEMAAGELLARCSAASLRGTNDGRLRDLGRIAAYALKHGGPDPKVVAYRSCG